MHGGTVKFLDELFQLLWQDFAPRFVVCVPEIFQIPSHGFSMMLLYDFMCTVTD